jgi:hypothetical protein
MGAAVVRARPLARASFPPNRIGLPSETDDNPMQFVHMALMEPNRSLPSLDDAVQDVARRREREREADAIARARLGSPGWGSAR